MDLDNFLGGLGEPAAAARMDVAPSIFKQAPGFSMDAFRARLANGYCIEDKQTSAMLRFGPLLASNYPQKELFKTIINCMYEGGPQRIIVLKSRKIGVSTLMGIINAEFAIQMNGWTCGTVAHTEASARKLFSIARNAIDRLNDAQKPPIRYNSEDRVEFGIRSKADRADGAHVSAHESKIKAETAAGRYPMSGDNVRCLHLSECAKYDSVGDMEAQERFILSALGSIPKSGPSLVVAESTANGKQGWFYKTWELAGNMKEDAHGVRWKRVFIPWHKDPACVMHVPNGYEWDKWDTQDKEREAALVERYGCTPNQIMFRRSVLLTEMNMNTDQWDQEYPESPEVAFTSGGSAFFNNDMLKHMGKECCQPEYVNTAIYDTGKMNLELEA